MPDGGYKADPGQVNAGATAFNQEGTELTTAAGKLTATVAAGKVGKAWQQVADPYTQAFAKFKDGITKYGTSATQFGGALSEASRSYSTNEENQQAAIKNKGQG
ncbi:hypothetical protein [Amycolatopsis nigrescens]|uniref:hypothetical protein n=1 Tax=Amycolatopsis nigrescens TaxID=381445 RepID=UPI000360785D|nr:hypothetical protein [Amycolatopsis nigrescens]